ncbi:MAG TPA: YceI family protein [Chitinophagales bacterium]|nr:YceI family protein [Chitinophagales bacterium]
MRKLFFSLTTTLLLAATISTQAQNKYFDKNCNVTFTSATPLEKIDGKNTSGMSVIDIESGAMDFAVLVKAFEFRQALLQEHFNENYMESEKYPKSTFKGQIKNISAVNFKTDGSYPVDVTGTLTLHGVSKEIQAKGTITVSGGTIQALSSFSVKPEDYNIEIPGVVKDKIAKDIEVKVAANYLPYTK